MKPETLAVHAARGPDRETGAVAQPLYLSTTFERATDGSYPSGFQYGRNDNPNRRALEQAVAALDGANDSLAFASGSAAVLAAFSLLRPGDHLLVPSECYYGTLKQVGKVIEPLGIAVSRVATWDLDEVRNSLRPQTRMIWVETPSNPLLRISDLAGLATLARTRGAWLACDSTLAPPPVQRPLELGADLVMHSSTKFLAGHSDVTGGLLSVREGGGELERLREYQAMMGAVPSPFDCWLTRRSLMTLQVRVRAQVAAAQAVAAFLAGQPSVEQVFYPGLARHAGHAVAARQMHGFGSMLSFTVPGGAPEAMRVAGRVRLFTRATSLGSVESLIEHRASIEGPGTTTPANLLRLSIGLEHADDLIEDLREALS
jgi:cystathionine gamma-synthase